MNDRPSPILAALAARYDILGEIGRGGMATVYRARDRTRGSDVAIKILRPELAVALGGERFTREVRVTAALQHPHILPLLDAGVADGLPYYVMPFVSGASLEELLQREGPLPVVDAVRYVSEMADGLSYAHGLGLIHRDIKPANILLSQGHALLADFGIARVLDTAGTEPLTDSGLAVGTAAYMSPEQAAGERVDARADIYAMGCVLYELLAGSPPFTASSQRALMARHAVDAVPSVRTVRAEVSRALEAVITRALAKTPADRYATAAEFRTALLRAEAAPASSVSSGWRSRRAIMASGVAALVMGALIAYVATHRASHQALADNRVIVFPLVLPADWTGSRTAGEDVSTMIGSAMDGAGALHWLDGWQLLPPARRDDMRSLSDSAANMLGRDHGARYVVTGRLTMRSVDSAEVLLSMRDLRTDSVVLRPRAVSPAREPWRAGLRAVTSMLPTLIPGGAPELRQWSERDPQAVAYFLAGEAAFRRVQLDEALTQFRQAVNADSSFGFAALRGAQVASWRHRLGDAASLVGVAMAHAASPRDRALAAGLGAFLEGRADSSIAALRTALSLDPEFGVAWTQLAETYTHLLPSTGLTDSLAHDALIHAIALDPGATQLLFHEVEIAARAGQALRTDSLGRRFLSTASDTMLRGEVDLITSCVKGRWTRALLRQAAEQRPQPLAIALKSVGLSHPACMRDGYAALLASDTAASSLAEGRRWFALVGLHHLLLAQGHADSALAEVDRFQARWKQGTSLLLLDAPVVPAFTARARLVASADSSRFGGDFHGVPYTSRLWLLGVWSAIDGRPATAMAVASDLLARAEHGGGAIDSARAESVLAQVTLARGDTADAIRRLTALLRRAVPADVAAWDPSVSLGLERLALGRLLVARHDYARARAVLEVLDSAQPANFPLFAPQAWRLRADAAVVMGDAAEAARLRQRAPRA